MGHARLSTLLVLMLPILLVSLQATTAARVPDQDNAEDGITIENLCNGTPVNEIKDCICNLLNSDDPETASLIKAKLRESPDFSQFEEGTDDTFCDDSSSNPDSTPVTSTDPSTPNTETDSSCTPETPTITTETPPITTETPPITTEPPPITPETPTSTPETPTSTPETPTSTPETPTSTPEAPTSTPETSTSTPETSTESSTSEAPPDLDLYKETETELEQITTILDDFIALVDTGDKAVHVDSVASARRRWGHRDLPVAWWKRVKSSRPREDIDICLEVSPSGEGTAICTTLEIQLQETDDLVGQLTENVDDWHASNLKELAVQRVGLQDTYDAANAEDSGFDQAVNDQFTEVVSSVKVNVQSGSSVVQEKIADLEDNTGDDNTGSIALVATLGSVGGLMVLSLVGVMIYGAVQKSKAKKKLSPKKAKNENIPIDAYSHDGPGRSPAKNDPYSAAPVPAPRNYHQPGHVDPRREPVYPEPVSGRPQQGLRRTNY